MELVHVLSNHYFGSPTLANVSSTLTPGCPGTILVQTSSLSLFASDMMVQLGLGPAFSHLKSST